MSSESEEFFLEDVADLNGGYAFKSEEYTDEGHFVLRTVNITDDGRITSNGAAYVSNDAAKKYERFQLKEFDTLFVMVGATLGKTGLVRNGDLPALLNQNMWVIRAKNSIVDPLYLHYAFKVLSKPLSSLASGSARGFVKRDDFRRMKIRLPKLKNQIKVSQLLGAIDDRVTLLRESNSTLEAIAQALFKSWFVDFDPVRSKSEGKLPEGMDEATAALFADGFEETELGIVPREWQLKTLTDVIELNPSRPLKKGVVAPYLDMASVATRGHRTDDPVLRELGSGTKFCNGDTLLARITPCLENGKAAFVDFLEEGCIGWGSTEFLVMRPKAKLPEYFAYLLCKHPPFVDYAIQSMVGTSGRQRIQNEGLSRYTIPIPPDAILKEFGQLVSVVQKNIAANDEQAKILSNLRDTLLPRLISGQLRITDAEAELEKVISLND